ncbi:tRNA uridine-5-carboxymethylaminomethyl(34) synthesis enzyme MnmG [Fidelibacter multiformis]|uniref:tRNA uridine-5-carboxymethylaminomethyl(34) synthesis enzyme MnmG n=1 Tax=Fidelibacter multiformis TaxID=3377529 RepID=UPI0037DDD465
MFHVKRTLEEFDVIVVGGGHAGVEAALAAARLRKKTALVTLSLKSIARMSCNPSIGGLAKGHLVRELDALGGEMGRAIDQTGIQFKMLNRSKGRAVWSPRAQADKRRYADYMQQTLLKTDNLHIIEGEGSRLIFSHASVRGVFLKDGRKIHGKSVILTNGTFLNGLIHIGPVQIASGRYGELPSTGLSDQLKAEGFVVKRLKTGTPCRVTHRSIDFSRMSPQHGDPDPEPFSYSTTSFYPKDIPCYLTHTQEQTHDILRSALHRSPLYAGDIRGTGPRYCPSIEDKIVRFHEKTAHQLFLEPEWEGSEQWYINGFSSSLPIDIQFKALRTVPGLEKAEFIKPGYAIEYDYFPSYQLRHSLETKDVSGLFFAGQINGTSGYEEAAVQGFMAAVNACRLLDGLDPVIFSRSDAYIGVLIDDLITKETDEPYRMFTSLAEYRLILRADNADHRLYPAAEKIGIQTPRLIERFRRSVHEKTRIKHLFKTTSCPKDSPLGLSHTRTERYDRLIKKHILLRECLPAVHREIFPEVQFHSLDQAFIETLYEGYIHRQEQMVEKMKLLEEKQIPEHFNYDMVKSLSNEGREKLKRFRPETLGQAGRIRGVSPSDIQILLIYLT